jgi:hypothetical protein
VGPFERELAVVADWDMWLRLSEVARAASVPYPTTAVLVHEGNMQITHVRRIRAEMDLMQRRHAHLLVGSQTRVGGVWTESWIADKQWQAESTLVNGLAYAWARIRRPNRIASIRGALARQFRPTLAPPWVSALLDI